MNLHCGLKRFQSLHFGLFWLFTLPKFAISQSEAKSYVVISYDIKSVTWYPAILWSLSSKVMLPYNRLQRGFANNKAQKSFPPKLNWRTLANCVDKYLNSQTEIMESELPKCEFGYGKYLIVPFWYASAAYQARLASPWVFWLDYVSPKYEPWLDQTRLICRRSVPKR